MTAPLASIDPRSISAAQRSALKRLAGGAVLYRAANGYGRPGNFVRLDVVRSLVALGLVHTPPAHPLSLSGAGRAMAQVLEERGPHRPLRRQRRGTAMTPKMEKALEAAERAGSEGLHWTAAGWQEPDGAPLDYHGGVIVSRLVHDRGYLAEAGKPGRSKASRRVITECGREYLIARRASVDTVRRAARTEQ